MAKELKDMTVAEAAASGQTEAYNKIVAGYSPQPIQPAPNTPMAVNTMVNGTKPIVAPKVNTTPTTGILNTQNDSGVAGLNVQPEPITPKSGLETQLAKITGDAQAGAGITPEENAALVKAKADKARASNELAQIDKTYQDEVKRIKSGAEGGFGPNAMNIALTKAYDAYNDRRANALIAYNSLSANFAEAQDTINLKKQSFQESLDNQIKLFQLSKDMVYNDMTESEKRQADQIETDKKAKNAEIANAKSSVLDALFEAGAPASAYALVDQAASKVGAKPEDIYAAASRYTGSSGVNSSVTNSQYAGVLGTILGSGKFTKDQARAVTNAVNNGEDPFTVVKNQAKNLLSGTNETSLTKYETAKSSLQDIQTNLQEFYDAGGKTNILTGSYEKAINKLGEVSDPKLVSLATQIASNLQVYRNAVSGTAYSVQEGQDIASIFPGINKTQGLNDAILKGRMLAFDSTIDSTYRSVLGSSYDTLRDLNSTKKEEVKTDITPEDEDIFNSTIKGGAPKKEIIENKDTTSQFGFRIPTFKFSNWFK